MYIAKLYDIEFLGETIDDVIDRVIEYEDEQEIPWDKQPEIDPIWVD